MHCRQHRESAPLPTCVCSALMTSNKHDPGQFKCSTASLQSEMRQMCAACFVCVQNVLLLVRAYADARPFAQSNHPDREREFCLGCKTPLCVHSKGLKQVWLA